MECAHRSGAVTRISSGGRSALRRETARPRGGIACDQAKFPFSPGAFPYRPQTMLGLPAREEMVTGGTNVVGSSTSAGPSTEAEVRAGTRAVVFVVSKVAVST